MDDGTPTARRRQQQGEIQPDQSQLARCLDASVLDRYLLERCIVPSLATVVPLQYHDHPWLPLLDMIVLYWTRGQTPAVRALGLRFETSRSSSLHLYALLRCGVPLLTHLLETWLLERPASPMMSTHPPQQQQQQQQEAVRSIRAVRRRLWLRNQLLHYPQKRILPVVRWVVHVLCWSGYLSSPDVAMVFSGCRYSSASTTTTTTPAVQPQVAFAHRRWMWELMWRTVLLLGATSWTHLRVPTEVWGRWRRRGAMKGTVDGTIERPLCPVCHQPPLQPVVPCVTCQHAYCYVCSVQQRKRCCAAAAE